MTVTWGQIDGDFNGKYNVSRVTGLTMLAANHRPDVRLAAFQHQDLVFTEDREVSATPETPTSTHKYHSWLAPVFPSFVVVYIFLDK